MAKEKAYLNMVEKTKELMTKGNVREYIRALVMLEQVRRLQPVKVRNL